LGAGMAVTGGGGMLRLLFCKDASAIYDEFALLFSGQNPSFKHQYGSILMGESLNIPREIVGDGVPAGIDPRGIRTWRALAPQLNLRANGLVGLPDADSESSMALSSVPEVSDEIEDTEPRLREKLACPCEGDTVAPEMLMRRW
jgi:hypothetical protein